VVIVMLLIQFEFPKSHLNELLRLLIGFPRARARPVGHKHILFTQHLQAFGSFN